MIRKVFNEYASAVTANRYAIPMTACDFITSVPENEFGIQEGYFEANDIAMLLRAHRYDPDAIHYMLTC